MAAKIERAHQMYRDGKHAEALGFYTEALASTKTNPQKIALRAACYLKLHDLRKAAEECTSVLELDHQHTGALMLRAQTLVTLKEYQSALFDFNRLIELNPSSDVYKNLQARLRTQLSLAPIPESEEESLLYEDEGDDEEREEDNGHENEISIQEVDEQSESTWKQSDFKEPLNGENLNRAKVTSSTAVCNTGNVSDVGNTKVELKSTCTPQIQKGDDGKGCSEDSTHAPSKRWETIPKPKGHSGLDYSKWDSVEDDSSEEDDDDDEQPQYRFRVRPIGVRPVKSDTLYILVFCQVRTEDFQKEIASPKSFNVKFRNYSYAAAFRHHFFVNIPWEMCLLPIVNGDCCPSPLPKKHPRCLAIFLCLPWFKSAEWQQKGHPGLFTG